MSAESLQHMSRVIQKPRPQHTPNLKSDAQSEPVPIMAKSSPLMKPTAESASQLCMASYTLPIF